MARASRTCARSLLSSPLPRCTFLYDRIRCKSRKAASVTIVPVSIKDSIGKWRSVSRSHALQMPLRVQLTGTPWTFANSVPTGKNSGSIDRPSPIFLRCALCVVAELLRCEAQGRAFARNYATRPQQPRCCGRAISPRRNRFDCSLWPTVRSNRSKNMRGKAEKW
jgi:hypothetical protein